MKYLLLASIALLCSCEADFDMTFPVGAKILKTYQSEGRPYVLWELEGNCYLYSSQHSDLSGNYSNAFYKCPVIIDPIYIVRAKQ